MKNNILWGSLFLLMFSVFIFTMRQTQFEKSTITARVNIEKKDMIDRFVERDLLQFQLNSSMNPFIKQIDKLIDSIGINEDDFLILCIPSNVCWNCLDRHLQKIIHATDKFHLKLVLFSHIQHFRNVKIYSFQNNFNLNIYKFDNPILAQLDQNLLFIFYDPKTSRTIPYIELNGFETTELLIKNYYEEKK